ncbi:MAG: 2-oxo acid dehydrogenase subunit E2 [Candidatus Thermoplasmatota archaeon]|jgi:pyruvate dehydrogenase E2 component (dihydrolipoamide acetyltransferase)|nr:2-oxo acid dehydrogenase subunit E2 [Candidatus Thermoplasmatota archaeon]MCL5794064.1 2-oxo acid dehydrogenase subunit E2 [Candidatus Thermoplasmatota archaeon]
MFEFKLPDIGEGVAEGEIVKWLIKEGDTISADQEMVEVMTDKVTVRIPSPVAGKVKTLFFPEGKVIRVGESLVLIDDGKAETSTNISTTAAQSSEAVTQEPSAPAGTKPAEHPPAGRIIASPAIRKAARDMGIDLEQVKPSGEGGRILMEDLENFKKAGVSKEKEVARTTSEPPKEAPKEASTPLKPGDTLLEPRGLRRLIFEKMTKSKAIMPHFTIIEKVNMSNLRETREELKSRDASITFTPLFVKTVVVALKDFPKFNAVYNEQSKNYTVKKYYNVGIAVDTPDGLTVAVVREADKKSVFVLSKEISELASKARENKLSLAEVQDSTFTISNVGTIGGVMSTPIINYPEVAILALHRMEINGKDAEMHISLSCDHRLIDGADAARFISRVKELMEKPSLIFVQD